MGEFFQIQDDYLVLLRGPPATRGRSGTDIPGNMCQLAGDGGPEESEPPNSGTLSSMPMVLSKEIFLGLAT
ncbi:unnamed protein product [Ranitomeya imitator]|uniref:Uncharacterized protein n=1 Tax=Ranitomeya imitator TaxID=111125 RepID=A0ABN9M6A0_9NEOB|nr:unnamed protein product [Ranitomeya imitator]